MTVQVMSPSVRAFGMCVDANASCVQALNVCH